MQNSKYVCASRHHHFALCIFNFTFYPQPLWNVDKKTVERILKNFDFFPLWKQSDFIHNPCE